MAETSSVVVFSSTSGVVAESLGDRKKIIAPTIAIKRMILRISFCFMVFMFMYDLIYVQLYHISCYPRLSFVFV